MVMAAATVIIMVVVRTPRCLTGTLVSLSTAGLAGIPAAAVDQRPAAVAQQRHHLLRPGRTGFEVGQEGAGLPAQGSQRVGHGHRWWHI
jgi:hypothetical protein